MIQHVDKYRTMEKMHSEALTALRNENAIEIEKMEEDKNNIMIQHVKAIDTIRNSHMEEENKLLEKIEHLNLKGLQDVHKAQEELNARHAKELHELQERLTKGQHQANETLVKQLEDEAERHNHEIKIEREKYQEQIQLLEQRWLKRQEDLKIALNVEYESRKGNLLQEFQQTIDDQKEKYDRLHEEKEGLNEKHQNKKQELLAAHEEVKLKYEQDLQRLKEEHEIALEKEREKVKLEHQERYLNLKRDYDRVKEQFEERVKLMEDSHQRTVNSTSRSYKSAIEELKNEITNQKVLQDKDASQFKSKIDRLKEEKLKVENTYESKMNKTISDMRDKHHQSVAVLKDEYAANLTKEKMILYLNILIKNCLKHFLKRKHKGFSKWLKVTEELRHKQEGYNKAAKFVVRSVLRYIRKKQHGHFMKWVQATQKSRSISQMKAVKGKQVLKRWFRVVEAKWQKRVSESFYLWYKYGIFQKNKDKSYNDVAAFIIREIIRSMKARQKQVLTKWKLIIEREKHLEKLNNLENTITQVNENHEKALNNLENTMTQVNENHESALIKEMVLRSFVVNVKKHTHHIMNLAFRIWEIATKQADTAELLGFVESNYKEKISEMTENFEVQVNKEKRIRQEEHETHTLKSCVKRIIWIYTEKLRRGFYPWKNKYKTEKQRHAAALMLYNCMQNNIARSTQTKFTLWLRTTLIKRSNAQRKRILENFRKVESYWEHRVKSITEERDIKHEKQIQKMINLKDELTQRLTQHKGRIKISNDKFIKKMKMEFDTAVKKLKIQYEEKVKKIKEKQDTNAQKVNINKPTLVDDVAAVPAPRRKSILSILKKQDKSLTRRHSIGNFGRAQSTTAATQFAKQQVQSFPSPQFQLRVPTATSPVSKTSTTVSNDTSSNYAIPRRSSLRAKNRRKSGTAGLRALMGVKTKLKAAKKNEK